MKHKHYRRTLSDSISELKSISNEGNYFGKSESPYQVHFKNSYKDGTSFVDKTPSAIPTLFSENLMNTSAYVTKDGVIVGHTQVSSSDKGFHPIETKVHKDHQRKGLASLMYNTIENQTGKKIIPSTNQTPEAKALWANPNRSFGKSESLEKAPPLSYDEAQLAESWSEHPHRDKREELHTSMMHPSHKNDRIEMIKDLSKDAKVKKIKNHWHVQLYRGIGVGEHPEDYKVEAKSYTYDPKVAKKFSEEYNGNVVKQWIPLQHISYSFNHAHNVGGFKNTANPHEGEVIVGPLHNYKKSLKKTEEYEVLMKFKKNSVCAMFMFDGVDHPDILHVTHKYFSDSLTESDKEKVLEILKGYFSKNPFKEINVVFDKVEYFGENEDVKVLRPSTSKPFLGDLKEAFDKIVPDKYPEYKPHVTVNNNVNKIDYPINDFVLVDSGEIVWRASDLKKAEPLMKPYVSEAQRKWAHTETGKKALVGEAAVAHWDKETKGKDLPEKLDKEELTHYSNTPNLQVLDPNKMGTSGVGGLQYKRGVPENKSTFYYAAGSKPEEMVTRQSKHKYTVTLPPDHKIYDYGSDPEGLIQEAKRINNGAWNEDLFHGVLKDKGYHGVRWKMPDNTEVVQHYYPLTPDKVEPIQKSEAADKETELIKENKMKPEAKVRHKFNAAKWTHPNGHPRCLTCGQEERIGGYCEPLEKSDKSNLIQAKLLLESPKEIEHLDMPENMVIQWALPQHKWGK